jgi:hypothetical protein
LREHHRQQRDGWQLALLGTNPEALEHAMTRYRLIWLAMLMLLSGCTDFDMRNAAACRDARCPTPAVAPGHLPS